MDDMEYMMKVAKFQGKENPEIFYKIGEKYLKGIDGVKKNLLTAQMWFAKGYVYGDEKCTKEIDKIKDIKTLEKLTKMYGKEKTELCLKLGNLYEDQGKKKSYLETKNDKMAYKWYELGMKKGDEKCKEALLNIDGFVCLSKLVKKYGKKNPVLYYRLGMRLSSIGRQYNAYELFKKGASLGDIDCEYGCGLYWKNNGHNNWAQQHFEKAAASGHEEAKKALQEVYASPKNSKNTNSSNYYTSKNVAYSSLFEPCSVNDSPYDAFVKKHIFIKCPCCGGEIGVSSFDADGKLYNEYVTIYNKGTSRERISNPFLIFTNDGKTVSASYKCRKCGYEFKRTQQTKLREEDKNDLKNMFKTYKEKETYEHVVIKYETISACDSVIKNTLKKASGKYDGKRY